MTKKKSGIEITREDKAAETPTVATEAEKPTTDIPAPKETPQEPTQAAESTPAAAVNGVGSSPINVLIYGNTGLGKTTSAALIEKPIFLLTEPQGEVIIKGVRDGLGLRTKIINIKSINDFNSALDKYNALAMAGHIGNEYWLVLDSVTDLFDMMTNEAMINKGAALNWGEKNMIDANILAAIRKLRDIPMNILINSQVREKLVEDSGLMSRKPNIGYGELYQKVSQMMNIVGYLRYVNENDSRDTRRMVQLRPANNEESMKGHAVLDITEHPNYDNWRIRIKDKTNDAAIAKQIRNSMFGIVE